MVAAAGVRRSRSSAALSAPGCATLPRQASLPELAHLRTGFAGVATHLRRALDSAKGLLASAPAQPRIHALGALRESLSSVGRHAQVETMARALRQLDETWRCPITQAPLHKPCLLSCGHVFEEQSVQSALLRRPGTCPMCRQPAQIVASKLNRAHWYADLWSAIAARRESFVSRYLHALDVPGDAIAPSGESLHQTLVRADFSALLRQRCHKDDLNDEETATLWVLATQVGAHACAAWLSKRTTPGAALQAALRDGDRLAFALSLRAAASVVDKRAALMLAIERDDRGILAFLLHRWQGQPIGAELLLQALKNGATSCFMHLQGNDYRASHAELAALLNFAVEQGRVGDIQLAMAAGADIDARDARGRTALLGAMELGRIPTIISLLDAGADPTAEDDTGFGPFCAAVRAGQFLAAQLFFDRNLPMATAGAAPFHALAEHDSVAYAPVFLDLGFRPNEANRHGVAPLALARQRGADALAAWLQQHS